MNKIAFFILFFLIGCKTNRLTYVIGLTSIGPEEKIFRSHLIWYDSFVLGKKEIEHIYLPDSFGLNDNGISCYTEDQLVNLLDNQLQLNSLEQLKSSNRENNDDYLSTRVSEADVYTPPIFLFFTISEETYFDDFSAVNEKVSKLSAEKNLVINHIPNSIDDLVLSENYKNNDSIFLEKSFKKYLEKMLDGIVSNMNNLTDDKKKSIKSTKLSFSKKSKSTLWASSNIKKKEIYISPFLLRAAMIITFSSYNSIENGVYLSNYTGKDRKEKYFNRSLLSGSKYMTENDFLLHNRLFDDYILNRLGFIIRHELAHIFLKTSNEKRCDCYAALTYQKSGIWQKEELGMFSEILIASIKNERGDLWGIESNNLEPLIKRFNLLDTIRNKIELTQSFCDSL